MSFRNSSYISRGMLMLTFVFSVVVLFMGSQAHAMNYDNIIVTSSPGAVVTTKTVTFNFSTNMGDPTECSFDSGPVAPCVSPYVTPVLADGSSHTFTVDVIDGFISDSYAWTNHNAPSLIGNNDVSGSGASPIAITTLQVDSVMAGTIPIKLTVPSGSLKLGTTTGLSFTGPTSGSTISFSGTIAALNQDLTSLVYTPTATGSYQISAYILGMDSENFNTIDGRVFQEISIPNNIDWATAKADAEASTYGGAAGYLAHDLSATQNTFIGERYTSNGWIGASDSANEGDWRWIGGPEDNQAFWSGDYTGSAVNNSFTAWANGDPDNYNGNENCGVLQGSASDPMWNDIDCEVAQSGYFVEYGDGITIPYEYKTAINVSVSPSVSHPSPPQTLTPLTGTQTPSISSNRTTPTTPSAQTATAATVPDTTAPDSSSETPASSPTKTNTQKAQTHATKIPFIVGGSIIGILIVIFMIRFVIKRIIL